VKSIQDSVLESNIHESRHVFANLHPALTYLLCILDDVAFALVLHLSFTCDRPCPSIQTSKKSEKMPRATKLESDFKKTAGKDVMPVNSSTAQPSPAISDMRGEHLGYSAGGAESADGLMGDKGMDNQKSRSFTLIKSDSCTSSTVESRHGLVQDSVCRTTSRHRIKNQDERLGDPESRTRAWLSTPRGYEIGMRREQSHEAHQSLYKLLQGVGLDSETGKGNIGISVDTPRQKWSSAVDDKRLFTLSGVGAWADTDATKIHC
jgi:hypothetical protein